MTKQRCVIVAALLGALVLVDRHSIVPVHAQSTDPCSAVGASEASVQTRASSAAVKSKAGQDPDYRDALWMHQANRLRGRVGKLSSAGLARDVGEIAVVEDAGDLIVRPNPFDLGDLALTLTPSSADRFDIGRGTYGFRRPLGTAVTLDDDATHEDTLRFTFPFFGQRYGRVFVNSDGNLTFDESDTASTDRSISRILQGPPRIAPLFADLDPSAAGRVLIANESNAYSVTWCGVPEFESSRVANAQVTLFPSGAIEIQVSSRTTIRDAIVAVAPGHTETFTPVDLSAAGGSSGTGAIGERFTNDAELDTIATLQRFFATHADDFDNVTIFTDTSAISDSFAYELTVSNAIEGLSLETFDAARQWGSTGRLQNLVVMDALSKYPDDPRETFLGENSTVSVLGQEFGHRWLAFLLFRDHNGRTSRQLLGRESAHWSFFFDSDSSVMEGNDIEDLGGGNFRTVAAVTRYSLLDQYAMGLIDQSQVPPFFYVQNATNVTPRRTATSAPEVGVTFSGTRRDVTIDAVIAANGPRVPSAADSPREYRQAFLYVTSPGRVVASTEIAKIDRIRIAWDQFLSEATDSRMRVDTRLTRERASMQ